MTFPSVYDRVIAGEAGAWASPIRGVLRAIEVAYAAGVARRNRRFDRCGPRHVLDVPVISVGNITAGGTGKTPMVIDLIERLDRMGYSPAVLARGYGAVDGGPNDEERLIRGRCPSAVYVANPDRAAGGMWATRHLGADVVVLDDGFQHRRLARSLDIVLIDATCPFGHDHLLPRGLLREPAASLCRADVVVVTRCDQVSEVALARIDQRLRRLAEDAMHIQCCHRVTDIVGLDGARMETSLAGRRVFLFAGVGNPRSFLTTVRSLGGKIVGTRWWKDHHAYQRSDLDGLLSVGRLPPHDLLLTTEKDAVKLAQHEGIPGGRIHVVRVAIDFVGEGGTMLQQALERALPREAAARAV